MHWPTVVLSFALAMGAAGTAQAQSTSPSTSQKVYRCGADGREYSQTPCKAGREIEVADPRTPEQQRTGQAVAERQARLADQLAAERHAREAAARGLGPAGIKPAPPVPDERVAKAERKKSKKKSKRHEPGHAEADHRVTWTAASRRP